MLHIWLDAGILTVHTVYTAQVSPLVPRCGGSPPPVALPPPATFLLSSQHQHQPRHLSLLIINTEGAALIRWYLFSIVFRKYFSTGVLRFLAVRKIGYVYNVIVHLRLVLVAATDAGCGDGDRSLQY